LFTPGQRLFEYEIVRLLGQGGFATVYEAYDRMLDRRVAIKQLALDKSADEKAVKRFIQEARIAAALEHPNMVTVYALRVAEKRLYMVLEYLPGGSLNDLVELQGGLPVEQTIKIVNGICEGLARLHARGIVHRDIKAENILMTADNRPKITDFGIAHVPEAVGGMGLTLVGFQPSTVIFSSPEQFRGEKLDTRSDIYQVGELLYYMLTGQHYINMAHLETQASTLQQNIRQELRLYVLLEKAICQDPPSGLATLRQQVGSLADVIGKALAKRKEDRYADVLELAADLWSTRFKSNTPSLSTASLSRTTLKSAPHS
jgi:serine/threonine protein kinase